MTRHLRVQDSPLVAAPVPSSFGGHPFCLLYTDYNFPPTDTSLGVEVEGYPYFSTAFLEEEPEPDLKTHYNSDPTVFDLNVLHSAETYDSIELGIIPGLYYFSWTLHLQARLVTGDAVGKPFAIVRPRVVFTNSVHTDDHLLTFINETNAPLTGVQRNQEDTIIISGVANVRALNEQVRLRLRVVPVDASDDTFDLLRFNWAEGSFRIVRLGDAIDPPGGPT